jgi:hypothetical protein
VRCTKSMFDSRFPSSRYETHIGSHDHAESRLFEGCLDISTQMCLKNTGNSLARVLAYIQTDSVTWKPTLRDYLLRGRESDETIEGKQFEKAIELQPGDSAQVEFRNQMDLVRDPDVTLHWIVLYENEIGQLYDTYIWAAFRVTSRELFSDNPERRMMQEAKQHIAERCPTDTAGIIPLGDPNKSFRIYSVDETKTVNQLFDHFLSRQK